MKLCFHDQLYEWMTPDAFVVWMEKVIPHTIPLEHSPVTKAMSFHVIDLQGTI
ncbi:hypothetical protein ACFOU2_25270 [Bacillus songklensis]|uniref:Uncharacterized protein n=1 Tax=Bacillus songklensis TaxID=1069116 RepID=A0ABV8BBJ2_9BACI